MEAHKPFTEERPWGHFRKFTSNEVSTVKILTINPGQMFSLQYHKSRTEFWRVLSGTPRITIGENVVEAKPGDEFLIEALTHHRIEAGDQIVEVLEIAYGEFDENDIVRLEDKYGRG